MLYRLAMLVVVLCASQAAGACQHAPRISSFRLGDLAL